MANTDHNTHGDHTGTIALLGGGALLLWLILHGGGFGLGGGDGVGLSGHTGDAPPTKAPPPAPSAVTAPQLPPVKVWIRASGIEVDGVAADLPTAIARARAAGRAEVSATGDAITGTIANVVRSLQAAGVVVLAKPDVWTSVGMTDLRTA